ncbi:hypothetical protein D3C86_1482800 [compost metagenome]
MKQLIINGIKIPDRDQRKPPFFSPCGRRTTACAQIVAATQPSHDRIAPVVRRRSKLDRQTESLPHAPATPPTDLDRGCGLRLRRLRPQRPRAKRGRGNLRQSGRGLRPAEGRPQRPARPARGLFLSGHLPERRDHGRRPAGPRPAGRHGLLLTDADHGRSGAQP